MEPNAKIFVTGATGFVGTRLVEALTERGHPVRALSRRDKPEAPPGSNADGGPLEHELVELVRGDLSDVDVLADGMEGCRYVFHLAAYAKNWARDRQTFFDINVSGMQNVFDAARQQDVERVVWTSTQLTLGPTPPGQVADEATPRFTERCFTAYEESKVAAEAIAFRYAKEGFPVVIVNPSRVFGPGHLTEGNSLSRVIDRYDRGKVPLLLNRGKNVANYVLVDDVVGGHILAMEKGRIGERYLLGSENLSLKEFFKLVDEASGKRHFQMPILGITPLVFSYLQKKRAQWFGVYPQITPGWVRTFMADWAHDCQKARDELGYNPTPIADGIRITHQWLQQLREHKS